MTSTAANRSARDLGPDDLVWDYFSWDNNNDMVARVDAAAAAGMAGVGMYIGAWAAMRDDPAAIAAFDEALERTGLVVANIEVVRGWASPDRAGAEALAREKLVWEIADRYECRYLQAIGDYEGTIAEAAVGFGALCDRAADHGLLVGIEWVPSMTNIETAATASEIAELADRPNGGFCVDSWHLTRSTNDIDDIRALNGARVFATQLNDGTVVPAHDDYYTDCLANRVVPGAGEFSLVEFIQALDGIGSTAPIGLEICSAPLWKESAEHAAQAGADGMRSVLAAARS